MPKTTRALRIDRTEKILNLLLLGFTRREITGYAAKEEWGISQRSIDRLIQAATAKIEEAANTKTEREIGLSILRTEDLYKRNIAIQDYKAALATLKERNELLGLKKQTGAPTGNVEIRVVYEPPEDTPNDETQDET